MSRFEYLSFVALIAVIAQSITMVLAALILSPRLSEAGPIDLEALYFANARPFFLLGSLLLVQLAIIDSAMLSLPFLGGENWVRLPAIVVALTAAASPDRRLHRVLPFVAGGLLLSFLALAVGR